MDPSGATITSRPRRMGVRTLRTNRRARRSVHEAVAGADAARRSAPSNRLKEAIFFTRNDRSGPVDGTRARLVLREPYLCNPRSGKAVASWHGTRAAPEERVPEGQVPRVLPHFPAEFRTRGTRPSGTRLKFAMDADSLGLGGCILSLLSRMKARCPQRALSHRRLRAGGLHP